MTCKDIGESLMDMVAGLAPAPEVKEHLRTCGACAERLEGLRQTMSLLEEWKAPEPSPYFDTRLKARLREEAAARPRGWLNWFRRPVLAVAVAALLVVGMSLLRTGQQNTPPPNDAKVLAEPGTAVGDLYDLDKNHELLANFDMLDDLDNQNNDASDMNP